MVGKAAGGPDLFYGGRDSFVEPFSATDFDYPNPPVLVHRHPSAVLAHSLPCLLIDKT